MICGHCGVGVRVEMTTHPYQLETPKPNGQNGVEVAHGQCPECGEVLVILRRGQFIWHEDGPDLRDASEAVSLFPLSKRRPLDEAVPTSIREDFQEAASMAGFSPRSSAALARRLLQRIIREHFGITDRSLGEEINTLRKEDLPPSLSRGLEVVRQLGNIAAHPNSTSVGEIVEVEADEADWMLEILELVCDYLFVATAKETERVNRINQKLTSMGKDKVPHD